MTTFSGSFVTFSVYSLTVVLCEFFDSCFFGGGLTTVSLVFSFEFVFGFSREEGMRA